MGSRSRCLVDVVALTPPDATALTELFAGDYYISEDLTGAIAAESFFNLVHLETVTKVDLTRSKLEWARESRSEVQLRDVRNLAAGGYDRSYVEQWTRHLALEAVWREVGDG
ncbi:MAG: hypothetical protein Q8Q85_15205 [Gemmatimonadales bacterium]|nr:hypothetical protein [Gemmatimonadales bacterium]